MAVERNKALHSEVNHPPLPALQEVEPYQPVIDVWSSVVPVIHSGDTVQLPQQEPAMRIEYWNGYEVELISDRSLDEEMQDGIEQYLLPGERPIRIKRVPLRLPEKQLSAEEVLLKLGDVTDPKDLGIYPMKASESFDGSEDVEEVNRFKTLFGRDSLVQSLFLDEIYPNFTARNVIRLAEKQGRKFDSASEEEMGKTLHEDRAPDDPVGIQIAAERGWKFPYFGTIDAQPQFLKAAMREAKRNAAFGKVRINDGKRTMEDAWLATKDYLQRKQKQSTAGLVEHSRLFATGIENQNWADSGDSLTHADGSLPDPDSPKAFFEVQVYTYDAYMDMADYYADKKPKLSYRLRKNAEELKTEIFERFWIEDERGGYFAPALERVQDTNGNDVLIPFEVRKSNMGHALWSRILEGDEPEVVDKREALLKTLHSSDIRNVSGFRTLSSKEVRFKPSGYHNGNVWPWDGVWIALGELHHGYKALAKRDMEDIQHAVDVSMREPEFVKGSDDPTTQFNEREVLTWSDVDQKFNLIEQVDQPLMGFTSSAMRRAEHELGSLDSQLPVAPIEQLCFDLMDIPESHDLVQLFAAD